MCAQNLESHFYKNIIIEQQQNQKYFEKNGNLFVATFFKISVYSLVNFGFDAFLHTLMYRMLKTGNFNFFVKLEMVAIFVFKIAPKFSIFFYIST